MEISRKKIYKTIIYFIHPNWVSKKSKIHVLRRGRVVSINISKLRTLSWKLQSCPFCFSFAVLLFNLYICPIWYLLIVGPCHQSFLSKANWEFEVANFNFRHFQVRCVVCRREIIWWIFCICTFAPQGLWRNHWLFALFATIFRKQKQNISTA